MWTWNLAEKATQMGLRYAIAADMVTNELYSYSVVNGSTITQGDPVPESAFGGASCLINAGAVSCSCKTGATCRANLVGTSNNDQASALTAVNSKIGRAHV